ncbi:MAG TPA: trehalose-phosphatase [Burkholderiales bacterium]|jgi:trehalose 6-phosphate phosphatase|nr:trehalose-phosphatase [Burkholderiales bacterium]
MARESVRGFVPARDREARRAAGGAAPPAFSAHWALFLDIDGTLVDFEDRPDAVRVDAGLKELLGELSRATDGAVALISGRPVREIDRLFAPLHLPAAGQHGAERRSAGGTLHLHAPVLDRMQEAADRLTRFAARHRGLIVEAKGVTLALHYRLAPRLRKAAEQKMRELAADLGADYSLQQGKQVLELRPCGHDKGTAVEAFLREPPFAGRVPVFVGDDLTDEFGFASVNRAGGHSVKVGPGASVAAWRLPDARAVRRWLRAGLEGRPQAASSLSRGTGRG